MNKIMLLDPVKFFFPLLIAIAPISGCQQMKNERPAFSHPSAFDVQGHRGCRGILPENSLAGFIQALEWGVNTLEMDVVISKDRQVVLSHEPFMSRFICLDSTGANIEQGHDIRYNIFEMTYQQILKFDCGSKTHPDFKGQKPASGAKPLLAEVIRAVESRRKELQLPPVYYNVETKISPSYDNIYHPAPPEFVELILEVISSENISPYTIIQSFDPRTLQQVKKQSPNMKVALLIENDLGPLGNIIQLGFKPDVYSPEHSLVDDSLLTYLHERDIKLIPWTVNDLSDMQRYIELGVDGLITDYPNLLLQELGRLQNKP